MGIGRVFRKLGLPAWTFVGIGISAIWFNYLAILFEKAMRDSLKITDKSSLWLSYVPPTLIFLLPFLPVLLILFWQRTRYALSTLAWSGADLQQPEGKKGLILLMSKVESAIYAINYHYQQQRTLERVWLIPSNDAEKAKFGDSTLPVAEQVERDVHALAGKEGRDLKIIIQRRGVSPSDSQDTFDYVNRLFRQSGYETGELIADFTGGTKPMSVGMIMACLPAQRELEYVSYNPATKLFYGPFLIDYQHRAFDLIG